MEAQSREFVARTKHSIRGCIRSVRCRGGTGSSSTAAGAANLTAMATHPAHALGTASMKMSTTCSHGRLRCKPLRRIACTCGGAACSGQGRQPRACRAAVARLAERNRNGTAPVPGVPSTVPGAWRLKPSGSACSGGPCNRSSTGCGGRTECVDRDRHPGRGQLRGLRCSADAPLHPADRHQAPLVTGRSWPGLPVRSGTRMQTQEAALYGTTVPSGSRDSFWPGGRVLGDRPSGRFRCGATVVVASCEARGPCATARRWYLVHPLQEMS